MAVTISDIATQTPDVNKEPDKITEYAAEKDKKIAQQQKLLESNKKQIAALSKLQEFKGGVFRRRRALIQQMKELQAFSLQSALITHQQIYSAEYPYVCDVTRDTVKRTDIQDIFAYIVVSCLKALKCVRSHYCSDVAEAASLLCCGHVLCVNSD